MHVLEVLIDIKMTYLLKDKQDTTYLPFSLGWNMFLDPCEANSKEEFCESSQPQVWDQQDPGVQWECRRREEEMYKWSKFIIQYLLPSPKFSLLRTKGLQWKITKERKHYGIFDVELWKKKKQLDDTNKQITRRYSSNNKSAIHCFFSFPTHFPTT